MIWTKVDLLIRYQIYDTKSMFQIISVVEIVLIKKKPLSKI